MRIDSSGRLLKGITTAISVANTPSTQLVGTNSSDSSIALVRQSNGGGEFVFAAGASGSDISSGNGLGFIKFMGYHTNGYDEYARIQAYADGTTGDGDAPGRLTFNTTADGASSTTERMRIYSAGRVLLGTTTEGNDGADDLTIATSAHTGITIRSGTGSQGNIYFSDGTSGSDEY